MTCAGMKAGRAGKLCKILVEATLNRLKYIVGTPRIATCLFLSYIMVSGLHFGLAFPSETQPYDSDILAVVPKIVQHS